MGILSIQSHVSFGHAGNSSAVFPLQRIGLEVWPVYTVGFSNHSGYGKLKGDIYKAETIRDVVSGIFEITDYNNCDAILTGYLGDASIGNCIIDIVKMIKKQNPKAKYYCDPVMGDIGRGFFVKEGIPEFFKKNILEVSDHISPNHFEFNYLTGTECRNYADIKNEANKIFDKGVSSILLTSFIGDETKKDELDIILMTPKMMIKVSTPLISNIEKPFVGTGDLIAALNLGNLLKFTDEKIALQNCVSSTYAIVKKTKELNRYELDLIGSQDEFITPTHLFKLEKI